MDALEQEQEQMYACDIQIQYQMESLRQKRILTPYCQTPSSSIDPILYIINESFIYVEIINTIAIILISTTVQT